MNNEEIKLKNQENCHCDDSCNCHEHDECTCGDDCQCTKDDKCMEECNCHEHDECTCGDDCQCTKNDKCSEECHDKDDKKHHDKKKHDKHMDKLNEAYNKISELEDSLIRNKAELVNYRKRKDEEVMRLLKYANEDVIKELLPTLDNFERAIKLDNLDMNDELSKFLSGFKMIYCTMVNTLNKYEVASIDGTSIPFDPAIHQAVIMDHVDNVEPGIVLEVLQKGYMYKDRVLRPAMVKVSE